MEPYVAAFAATGSCSGIYKIKGTSDPLHSAAALNAHLRPMEESWKVRIASCDWVRGDETRLEFRMIPA